MIFGCALLTFFVQSSRKLANAGRSILMPGGVLPEHLHCVWTLPIGDVDNANRWRVIKQGFSKVLPMTERRSAVRIVRGERGIWQRRFWEHAIRDDADYAAHVDYCHINLVKYCLVKQVSDWPYSTFHRYVEQGFYPLIWATFPSIGFVGCGRG